MSACPQPRLAGKGFPDSDLREASRRSHDTIAAAQSTKTDRAHSRAAAVHIKPKRKALPSPQLEPFDVADIPADPIEDIEDQLQEFIQRKTLPQMAENPPGIGRLSADALHAEDQTS